MIMRVYFVTQKDFGLSIILKPKIPESSPEYEGKIPRICVSTSILGALSSIGGNLGLNCNTYIYKCDLDDSEVIQPGNNINDVKSGREKTYSFDNPEEAIKWLKS